MSSVAFPYTSSAKELQHHTAEYPIGASGAVGTAVRNHGIASLVNTGTGLYTITLNDFASSIVSVDVQIEDGTYAATDAHIVVPNARTTNIANPTVTITTIRPDTGVAAHPRNGASLLINIVTKKVAG